MWDVNSEANNAVCEEIRGRGGRATAFTCDLSDKDQIYQTAAKVNKMNEWIYNDGYCCDVNDGELMENNQLFYR